MTGPEHYRKAEDLARTADHYPPDTYDRLGDSTLAQVHATLALAAATANGTLDRTNWLRATLTDEELTNVREHAAD